MANPTPSTEAKSKRKYKYIGPDYTKGLVLPNLRRIDPKNMSDQQIAKLIKEFPAAEKYFKYG